MRVRAAGPDRAYAVGIHGEASQVSAASGRCLDVRGDFDTVGTALDIQDCDDQANQTFEFTSAGELRTMSGLGFR